MWKSPTLSAIVDDERTMTAKVHAYVFGSTTKKVYVFRGTWRPLSLLNDISKKLEPCFQHRAVKKCTKKVGRTLRRSIFFSSGPDARVQTRTETDTPFFCHF
jgi:hypothetical protein